MAFKFRFVLEKCECELETTRKSTPGPNPSLNKFAIWEKRRDVSLAESGAERSLLSLYLKGCDPLIVLRLLEVYLGLDDDHAQFKQRARDWHARIERLCRRLKKDAEELRSIDGHLRLDLDLPRQITACVHNLRGMIAYEKSELMETVLPRKGKRQPYLYLTVLFVKRLTKRPHYPELTTILSAITGRPLEEDALRKNVKNWRENERFDKGELNRQLAKVLRLNKSLSPSEVLGRLAL